MGSGRRSRRKRPGTPLAAGAAPRRRSALDAGWPIPTAPVATALICAMTIIALVLGGGGTTNPTAELLLEAGAVSLALVLALRPDWSAGLAPIPRVLWLLAALVVAMPVLDLVPLPPSWWQALPLRGQERAALALIGADHDWMPLSVAPARTFAALLATIIPLLLMLLVARLDEAGRHWLCLAVVATGVASVLVGAAQITRTGGVSWSWYSLHHEGFVIGFFANHNPQADFLLIAMMASAAAIPAWLGRRGHALAAWLVLGAGVLTWLAAVFATGSRTGIILSPVALAVVLAIVWPPLSARLRRAWLWAALALPAGSVAIWLALQTPQMQRVLERFSADREGRWTIWRVSRGLLAQLWPWGGGVGTFRELYNMVEPLDTVDRAEAGRAHSDWLEWLIEGGLPGVVVLAVALVVVGVLITRAVIALRIPRDAPGRIGRLARAQVLLGFGVLAVLGLHAIDDFPLRSMALASLLGIAGALIVPPRPLNPPQAGPADATIPESDDGAAESALPQGQNRPPMVADFSVQA